ncbi:MAG: mannose-1-phosphate guanylyltransferase [Armatimonadota bacterium]
MGETGTTRIGVIMAGGTGERFWPVSRPDRPKQLLPLGPSSRTLLEDTVYRLGDLVERDRLMVVTSRRLREPVIESGIPLAAEQVVAEPTKRNTLGAVAWATAQALGRTGLSAEDVTLAIIPADQYVGDVERFRDDLRTALAAAEQMDALVTIGIEPTRPETGYGYIEFEDSPLTVSGVPGAEAKLRPVERFREKPNAETAEEFFASGRFLWNGGMFLWRVSTFLAELERADPEVAEALRRMISAVADGDDEEAERLFGELPNLSIDYALMEHARRVVVVRAGFPWDDVGAWDAWQRVTDCDAHGNATHGRPLLIDCDECSVYNEPGQEEMFVAVIGMERVIVAVTDDGLLVAPLDRAQQVREVVRRRNEAQAPGGSEG